MKTSKLAQLVMTVAASVVSYSHAFAIENEDIPPIGIISDVGTDLPTVLANVTTWILTLAGALAVLYLIWGGITYITGGEKGAESGKKMITNAIIGIAIIALSIVIVRAVLTAIGA